MSSNWKTNMIAYLIVALVVFGANIVPFFMPATWTLLVFIAVHFGLSFLPLAVIGAVSATLGRLVLAKLSGTIVRQKFLNETTRKNVDDIKRHLGEKRALTFGIVLFYAFSPFPSNQLFIAYGLTRMDLKLIAIPFFLGRLVSYTALTFSVASAVKKYLPDSLGATFGGYFLIVQLLTIVTVYLFTKINWHELFTKKKVSLLEK